MNKLLYTALIAFILIIGSNLTLAFGSFNTNIIFGIWSLFNLFLTIFYLLSFNALLLKIAVALILLINSFFLYIGEYLNIEIDINIISSIMNTNYSEAMETINAISIFMAIIYIIIIFFLLKIRIKPSTIFQHKIFITSLLVSFFINGIFTFYTNNKQHTKSHEKTLQLQKIISFNTNLYPTNYIFNFIKYITISSGDFTYIDVIKNNNFKKIETNQPYTIVLVIGETSRGENFSLNGYNRKTNPNLEKIKNLVYFKNFEACYNYTNYSVSCMLSFYNTNKFVSKSNYYIKKDIASSTIPFSYFNFNTHFISTNSYAPASPMYQYFKNFNHIKFLTYSLNYLDVDLNEELKKILNNKSQKNKLIILHTMGSHYKYSNRYPKEFLKFSPICGDKPIKSCSKDEIINDYDNTILYVDFVLSEFINSLNNSNQPALLIYTSDHGESLGDINIKIKGKSYKKYYHGSAHSEYISNPNLKKQLHTEFHIPALIWFSDKWLNTFGSSQLNSAKKLVNKPLNHDYISNSLNDCAFISAKIINKQLSFCSAK